MLGHIEEFDSSKDYKPQYLERLEYFFIVNGITTAEKERVVLLLVIGAAMYKTLWNLVSPSQWYPSLRSCSLPQSSTIFRDTLETMLRNHIVCGINDDAIQKILLSETGLDYTKPDSNEHGDSCTERQWPQEIW